jgi:hypothetical protein
VSHALNFNVLYAYDMAAVGIQLPVTLSVGEKSVRFLAKIDTGATFCVFEHELGEDLGLDIESGTPQKIGTVVGSFLAYGHSLSLAALDYHFDVIVYFAATKDFNRNVLGRHGWLNKVRLGIIDYDGKLYISAYDEP